MDLSNISTAGWASIVTISFFIFIILMIRGIRFKYGDKSISIGKKLDDKLQTFKKDMEIETVKKEKDSALQKELFRKSLKIDEWCFANLLKIVKKLDAEVYDMIQSHVSCQFPALSILDIFEDVLTQRLYFNNIKKKLSSKYQKDYLDEILQDVKTAYGSFYLRLKQVPGNEAYPEWAIIESGVRDVLHIWAHRSLKAYMQCVRKKMSMYKKMASSFETEKMKVIAIDEPLKKNGRYFKLLKASLAMLNERKGGLDS